MLTDRTRDGVTALGLPAWAAPPPPDAPGSSRRGAAVRFVVALVVAGVLARLGHRVPATVLVAAASTVTVVGVARPGVSAAIDRAVARLQAWAGRALTVVLLGALHLAVFVPVAVVARVLRIDPLAPAGRRARAGRAGGRARPGPATGWEPVPRSTGLYRRPYALERLAPAGARTAPAAPGPPRRPLARTRGALGLVVLLLLADVGAGALLAARDRPPAARPDPVEVLMQAPDVGARRGEPWAQELYDELMAAFEQTRYHPFRGWTAPDFTGRHVTVRDEARRSYEPAAATGAAVEVFFFGGSTMMGWFQRDEHTIPSVIARLAEADGIPLRVRNYGQPAYMNWQEVMLLQELVSRGEVPHLAVFYDGANELGAQFRAGPSDDPIHLQARAIESRLRAIREGEDDAPALRRLWEAYSELSALHRLVDRAAEVVPVIESTAPARVEHPWPNQAEHPEERGRAAARLHHRGVELARAAGAGFGFRTAFFWQPMAYTKARILPGEEPVIGSWGTDPGAWSAAYATARAGLHPAVIDVSDALDGVDEPVMYDFGHTNERGAEAVARVLYHRLRPVLAELAAEVAGAGGVATR